MREYEIVVGLEVHAELNTKTKIYCGCKNAFGSEVNTNCCPICLGMPGTLPTLNKSVVEYAIRMGHALGCTINPVSKMDRKNYFYPDLPKAYQISQFDIPLCEHGYLDVMLDEEGTTKRIGITRIHIEEDAGKLIHGEEFSGSLVDFNRCGVPLIEIVSEPDMRSSHEAHAYLEGLRDVLMTLGISDCKMQEGSIRCDVNVSVRPKGSQEFGTRCEMKNVNSFSGAQRAIDYEAQRQIAILEAGGTITQETRRWDDLKGQNFLLRSKEDAQDYRYFPEPDLLTIVVDEADIRRWKEELPELPHHKLLRFLKDYQLPYFDANLLVEDLEKAPFFEECAKLGLCSSRAIANWLNGEVTRLLADRKETLAQSRLTPEGLAQMIQMIEKKEISNTAGKTVLEELLATGKAPAQIVQEKGLGQISDSGALEPIARQVLADNPDAVAKYKNGKTNIVGFLVGQCMKASKGKGNPALFNKMILEMIDQM